MEELFSINTSSFHLFFNWLLHLFNFTHEGRKLPLFSLWLQYFINTSETISYWRDRSFFLDKFFFNLLLLGRFKLFDSGDGFFLRTELFLLFSCDSNIKYFLLFALRILILFIVNLRISFLILGLFRRCNFLENLNGVAVCLTRKSFHRRSGRGKRLFGAFALRWVYQEGLSSSGWRNYLRNFFCGHLVIWNLNGESQGMDGMSHNRRLFFIRVLPFRVLSKSQFFSSRLRFHQEPAAYRTILSSRITNWALLFL